VPGRGTTKSGIRVPEDLWRRFGEQATANGTDRSSLLREWIRWYLHDPDAKAPKRP
jgi:metal-responsive CopG/Arc/MetJ family transcriptional regulator